MTAFNLNRVTLQFTIADVSTAGQVFVPVPEEFDGEVIEIRTVLNGAIITADAVLTPKINGVALTNGIITIDQSGSATGDIDFSRPTGLNTVRAGEAIEIETTGASGNTVEVFGTIVILR